MTHRNEEDVFRSRDPRDQLAGLDLFKQLPVAEAEAELRHDFLEPEDADPAPAPRARDETQAFDGPEAVTERERKERIERIQRAVREPLLAVALKRKDWTESPGVTAKDARQIADRLGLTPLLGHQQRAWSWLSTWLGKLATEGVLVKYKVAGMVVKRMADNGNEQVVYLHPYDHRARTAA